MNIHEINPYIRAAMPSRLSATFHINQRIIFDYELIYVESGRFTFIYDGICLSAQTGDFLFIRPGICHSFHNLDEEVSQPHIHFDICYASDSRKVPVSFKDLPDLTPAEQQMIRADLFAPYPQSPRIQFSDPEILETFYAVIDPQTPIHSLHKKALLLQLIDQLISDNFPQSLSGSTEPLLPAQQLKEYIDAGQGLTYNLDDFENQFSYSKFYLEKQFRQLYGLPVITYLNKKRMEIAAHLLTTHTVTETAKETGFLSIYSFSRAFKKYWGISPSEYRSTLGS